MITAQHLEKLTGFKRYATAFLLGVLMTLVLPPIGFFPMLLCATAMIVLARAAPTPFKSFLVGWAFGAGYFIFGLYWISAALFVDIHEWGWVLPFSAVLGPAALALFYGLIPLPAWRYRANPAAHALMMTASWSLIEWLRGHVLTGFPWNLPGSAWANVLPVMQVSAAVGIYGLTLLTVLWAATPALVKNRKLAAAVVCTFIVAIVAGTARLALHPTENTPYTVRIVQANISEKMKWSQDDDWRNLDKHVALMQSKKPVTFVIWPETAVTADLRQFPQIADYIALKMPQGSTAILGTLRVTEDKGAYSYYNSVSVLDRKSKVIASYDKHHLVPFGEYIPFRDKLKVTPIALAISGIGDFTPGSGPGTLSIPGLPPFSPLVCYEVIFPHEVVPENNRPAWMVNVTNDAWYGLTAGPYQHFDTARVRAIEEGLPLARAANTGISAMIDPLGRVIARQELGTSGAIDSPLPAPLPPTLYARFGDSLFFGLLLLVAGLGEWVYRGRRTP